SRSDPALDTREGLAVMRADPAWRRGPRMDRLNVEPTGRAGEAPRGGAGWRVPTWSAAQRGPSGGGAGRRLALSPFRYARSRTRSPPASQVQQRRPGKDDPRRPMTRFVITPDAALHAAQHRIAIPPEHQLLAPTL